MDCHAPRERVSWNGKVTTGEDGNAVTLHVSVWVEIEEVNYYGKNTNVTLHVSVWVEISCTVYKRFIVMSRSTWACELKSQATDLTPNTKGHAPRERVSWNCKIVIYSDLRKCHVPRERVGQFSFQRRTYWYWIIQVTAWLRSGGIFIPKYYTIFMRFPSNSPIHTPKFVQTNDL